MNQMCTWKNHIQRQKQGERAGVMAPLTLEKTLIICLCSKVQQTLPETRSFPCARIFAVCTISGTRQREYLPCATKGTHDKLNGTRQMSCLPCATKKTLGKAVDTRQCRMFAVCHDLQHTAKKKTHGKMYSLPCAMKDTQQNVVFAVCLFLAHGKFV